MASKIEVDEIMNAGGDNDTGIDLATNDQVKVNIANAQAIKVTGTQTDIKVSASRELNILKDSSDDALVLQSSAPDASNNLRTIELAGEKVTFSTGASSGTSATERMLLSATGEFFIGKTGEVSTQDGFHFKQTGECIIGRGSNDTVFVFQDINSSGATVGSISITSSNTAYNTSSDYRLKENVTTSWDATTRLKQLKPSRFNFKIDKDKTVDGFLAHEVSSIVPEAITGEKDAVDKDGNIKPQAIDHSKLVPLLVKTIQELEARIATLESK